MRGPLIQEKPSTPEERFFIQVENYLQRGALHDEGYLSYARTTYSEKAFHTGGILREFLLKTSSP